MMFWMRIIQTSTSTEAVCVQCGGGGIFADVFPIGGDNGVCVCVCVRACVRLYWT